MNNKFMEFNEFIEKSPIRQNIINWHKFGDKASVLYISPKEDSIYEYLKEISDKVELMPPNMVLNADLIKSYDYILCIGNEDIYKDKDCYTKFLIKSKALLKDSGQIILALNNRLAIDGFINEDMRGCVSKAELESVILSAGLCADKFFYPYPDYLFPNEIFTDFTLKSQKYGRSYININEGFMEGFDKAKLSWDLADESILDSFVNSFLVFIVKENYQHYDKDKDSAVIYAKLNNDRNDYLRTATIITRDREGIKHIYKKPLNKKALSHINRITENENKEISSNIVNLRGRLLDDMLIYDFIEEKSLDTILKEYIECGQRDKILNKIEAWFSVYFGCFEIKNVNYLTEEFKRVFGEGTDEKLDCIMPANIDLIFDNIYEKENNYTLIDCEWVFDFYVPVSFIKWRAINELYCKYWEALNSIMERDRMLEYFGIDNKTSDLFQSFSEHFAKVYVGGNALERYMLPTINIPLMNILRQYKNEFFITSSLYFDMGEGYSENKRLESTVLMRQEADGFKSFIQSFRLADKTDIRSVAGLRFDPVEGKACECIIDEIKGIERVNINPIDAEKSNGRELFMTLDPAYIIEGTAYESIVTVYGKIRMLSEYEIMLKYNELRSSANKGIKNKIKGLLHR